MWSAIVALISLVPLLAQALSGKQAAQDELRRRFTAFKNFFSSGNQAADDRQDSLEQKEELKKEKEKLQNESTERTEA